jgi:regulatory protein YycI of two-component signal transduction system YycFG
VDRSIIKNCIIIILALVNVFLLYIVLHNTGEERLAEVNRKQALATVLSENGITLNEDISLPDKVASQVSLSRDSGQEQSKISALLGNCVVTDQGGNIYHYEGTNGSAQLQGSGEFIISLNYGDITSGRDPSTAAKAAMKKLGLAYSGAEPDVKTEGDTTIVTLNCSYKNTPVYNAQIEFDFYGESLRIISGKRLLDEETQVSSAATYLDSVTVLMKFLESVRQTGDVCSEISDLEIGYYISPSSSGDCTLKPVWRIQTNSRPYYIDAQTGKAETIDNTDIS